jgi:hypothetical protein
MAVIWNEQVRNETYLATIGLATYDAVWQPCTFSGGRAQVAGKAIGDKVVFRNTAGIPLPNVKYEISDVDATSFAVPSAQIPDQTCEWSPSRLGEVISYGREFIDLQWPGMFEARWANLVRDFLIQSFDTVLVVGCGCGYLIKAAHDAGFPNVWGVENCTAMMTDVPDGVEIAQVDFTQSGVGQAKQIIKNVTGQATFSFVISEDFAPGFTDQEVVVGSNVEAGWLTNNLPQANVINMVTEAPISDTRWNSKTLEEWKALVPNQSWVSIRLSQWRVL